ncbi:hypothetical protein SAMN05421828_103192 [Acidiphilium rubrum]|uniref:Uncharacterized protein n=1 Tax=Acidiphilium rubrum TaxID=526 RepID=A0A8G2CIQ3_ACIRU|nr:hypothetical protein SAMN05421828_103192 [Acidiphilium rubrum]
MTDEDTIDQFADDVVKADKTQSRYSRRLSDKILIAFHHACDQDDYEIAEQLLVILEHMLTRRSPNSDANRRKSIESLVAAHERLWHLRHPEQKYA